MSRPPKLKTDQVVHLAERPEGVNSHQVQELFGCDANAAGALLLRAVVHHGLVRARAPGGRYHYHRTAELSQQWLARQMARTSAELRAAQRLVDDVQARALEAKALRDARQAEAAKARAARDARLAELDALRARNGGRLPRKRASVLPASNPAKPHAALGPAGGHVPVAPAAPGPEPLRTVHQSTPPAGRVNIMADPLPTVPGWRTGPYIRPGAMDFRQHQRHGGQGV